MVLAERDKDDMDKQLKKALGRQKLEWHTRSGAPHAIADLEKVAAGQARTIIVLQPDEEEVSPCLDDTKYACSLGALHLAFCKVHALRMSSSCFVSSCQQVVALSLWLTSGSCCVETQCHLPAVQPGNTAVKHMGAVQDAGKKLVSALLGLQSTRAATQPRPFLRLQRQHLAVQARLATASPQPSPLLRAIHRALTADPTPSCGPPNPAELHACMHAC